MTRRPDDTEPTEDNGHVEFGRRRSEHHTVRVMPMRQAVLAIVMSIFTSAIGSGALWRWLAIQFVQEQIQAHDRDANAHPFLLRQLDQGSYSDQENAREKAALKSQLEQLSIDVKQTREAVIRLEARLSRSGK